ncbi:hypothetical protein J2Z23_002421 [Lederbergia galactosidilyticus]|nr:hypothetical protein [Lederbergia galactosidilytica]
MRRPGGSLKAQRPVASPALVHPCTLQRRFEPRRMGLRPSGSLKAQRPVALPVLVATPF